MIETLREGYKRRRQNQTTEGENKKAWLEGAGPSSSDPIERSQEMQIQMPIPVMVDGQTVWLEVQHV